MYDEIKTKQMSIIEIFKIALSIFKNNIKSIFLITFIIFIPINIVNVIIPLDTILTEIQDLAFKVESLNYDVTTLEILSNTILEFAKWNLIKFSINQFFGCLAIMAVALITYQTVNGKSIDYKSSLEEAFSTWLPAIVTILLSTIITMILYFFMIIPALIFSVYANFIVYVVILKKQKSLSAIKYSMEIVKFRFLKTAARIIIIFILQFTLTLLFTSIFYYPSIIVDFIINCLNTCVIMFFWVFDTIWFLNYDFFRPNK